MTDPLTPQLRLSVALGELEERHPKEAKRIREPLYALLKIYDEHIRSLKKELSLARLGERPAADDD